MFQIRLALLLLTTVMLTSVYCSKSAFASPTNASVETISEEEQPNKSNELVDRSAYEWLMFMQTSLKERNYIGTFMFSRGAMSSTMSIVHRYESGVESERIKQLDGEMGEIVRSGKRVMCVFPGNRVVEVEGSPLSKNFSDKFVGFMPGQSQYELSVSGTERVVERECTVLDMRAKDDDRYSYRLWIDSSKGLLLKSEVLDLEGNSLEKFQYTQVDYPDEISPALFEFDTDGEKINHEVIPMVEKDESWPDALMWELGWVPVGYTKINGKTKAGDNILVYSDGLATFSVFVETMKQDAMPEGASMVGATLAYSMDNTVMDQQYHVTVVGEIPPMTAMKIAKSVKPKM